MLIISLCVETSYRIQPIRVLQSSYMTSLNGPGFSLTLLNVSAAEVRLSSGSGSSNSQVKADVAALIDRETEASAWVGPSCSLAKEWASRDRKAPEQSTPVSRRAGKAGPGNGKGVSQMTIDALKSACEAVIADEPSITHADTLVGDGDCGLTWANGAKGALCLCPF